MRQQTELMRSILTDETAQRIIDFVSPIYGDSYVGLWLFQAIGVALSDICAFAEQLRYETNACTADMLLDYWERQYGLSTVLSDIYVGNETLTANVDGVSIDGDTVLFASGIASADSETLTITSGLTKEQRRERIITKKQAHGPCNPTRLAAAISVALGGAETVIEENVDQNTFMVHIRDQVVSVAPAIAVTDKKKPAHLIYGISVDAPYETAGSVKTAVTVTYEESYTFN